MIASRNMASRSHGAVNLVRYPGLEIRKHGLSDHAQSRSMGGRREREPFLRHRSIGKTIA
jgi:hypothetical protein